MSLEPNLPQSLPQAKALVVDDELSNRVILRSLLKKNGYQVIEAQDGLQAVEKFDAEGPDIIFMDVMMPGLDGYEATTRIKQRAGENFIPVIFLTALTDDQALVRCVEAGGDDFLTKPFSHIILRSKIQAMERIRSLNAQVGRLYNRMRQEEELAEVVFSTAVLAGNVGLDNIPHRLQSADIFSGDILLTARAPNGDLHLLLGDFTGHGLSAALGALPTAEVFRAMTAKGFSPGQILGAINRKLHGLLPTGMFLAAIFVHLPMGLEYIEVCNCGLPDGLLLQAGGHAVRERIPSTMLPLGIMPDQNMEQGLHGYRVSDGDRLLLTSDGVLEAHGPNGDMYGRERFEQAIRDSAGESVVLDAINRSLDEFCAGASQADDITLVELPCDSSLFASSQPSPAQAGPRPRMESPMQTGRAKAVEEWGTSLTLRGARLGRQDPVPLLINQLREFEGEDFNYRPLFTIMTELFVNALDHGVLRLDSSIKADAEGFGRYFMQREQRLDRLSTGEVSISLICESVEQERLLRIRVQDSGPGFDHETLVIEDSADPLRLHGRGIHLLKSLCVSLDYLGAGNTVEAIYRLGD